MGYHEILDLAGLRFPASWKKRRGGHELTVGLCHRPGTNLEVRASARTRPGAIARVRRFAPEAQLARLVASAYSGPVNDNALVATRASTIAGTGVFARRLIASGARIEDVTRPLVPYSQVPQPGEPGYGHAIQIARGRWLLLDHSLLYYLNHCCRPNTRLRIKGATVSVNATRRIRRGEE